MTAEQARDREIARARRSGPEYPAAARLAMRAWLPLHRREVEARRKRVAS